MRDYASDEFKHLVDRVIELTAENARLKERMQANKEFTELVDRLRENAEIRAAAQELTEGARRTYDKMDQEVLAAMIGVPIDPSEDEPEDAPYDPYDPDLNNAKVEGAL